MSTDKFLVTGATGETGRSTVKELLARGHAVRALVHSEDDRSSALRQLGVEVVVGDMLEHDDVIEAARGTTAAYFCYPVRPGIIPATAYLADAAKRAGLKVVVNMSQISAREDSKSHAARDHWIAERIFDWSGIPVIHLRPTFFSQWFLYGHSKSSILREGVIDLPYGQGRHAPIAAEDQARLIAVLLENPKHHIGNTYTLHGPIEMSQAEIAAAIGQTLGVEMNYRPLTIEQYKTRLEGQGLPPFVIQHFCAIALDYQNGIFAGSDSIIERLTGTPPLTVQHFINLHAKQFTKTKAA